MLSIKMLALLGLVTVFSVVSESANILGIFTTFSPSHLIIHMSYARLLAVRGHNVTVVTTHPLKDKYPGVHHIYIPPKKDAITKSKEILAAVSKPKGPILSLITMLKAFYDFSNMEFDALKDQRFQDLLHNPSNEFDLVIMGYLFNDYQIGYGLHFKCPVVISWVFSSILFVDRYVGNPKEIAYVRSSPLRSKPDVLTFKGRLVNFITDIFVQTYNIFIVCQNNGYYNDLFPSPQYPSLEEAGKKVSLLLCNSHFSDGFIRPNVPAAIEVGGIQIKDNPDPLPRDLQEIFNASSEHGVIYLSFGSNLGSRDLSPDIVEIIYKTLAGLKQTVVWKWDESEIPGNASNIYYRKWLPQDDILAHPNLRLFITHAGKGGIIESQYHGVPMVAIPFFSDQFPNADLLESDGFGVKIDRNAMNVESLTSAILSVIEDPMYKKNLQRFSALYKDRPMTARATAAYWIEYVIRHKGAYHMQSPLLHLSAWQHMSVDVVAFLLLVVFFLYKLVKISVKFVFRKVCWLIINKNFSSVLTQ